MYIGCMKQQLKGSLTSAQMADLNSLILKLQRFNLSNLTSGEKIKLSDIRPIPGEENRRLWIYIRHICRMAVLNGRNFLVVQAISSRDRSSDVRELVEDAVNDMSIHVYRYVWRKYESSDNAGYVYGSAYQGFRTWSDQQNERLGFSDKARGIFESYKGDVSGNHKVSNVKPS